MKAFIEHCEKSESATFLAHVTNQQIKVVEGDGKTTDRVVDLENKAELDGINSKLSNLSNLSKEVTHFHVFIAANRLLGFSPGDALNAYFEGLRKGFTHNKYAIFQRQGFVPADDVLQSVQDIVSFTRETFASNNNDCNSVMKRLNEKKPVILSVKFDAEHHRIYIAIRKDVTTTGDEKFHVAISNFGLGMKDEQKLPLNNGVRTAMFWQRILDTDDEAKAVVSTALELSRGVSGNKHVADLYTNGSPCPVSHEWEEAPIQVTGNCAIFNLQQAIKWVLKLNNEVHLKLNAHLILGADKWLLEEEKTWKV